MRFRWSLRAQMLLPTALLLAALVGVSAWTASAAADRARGQVGERVRDAASTLAVSRFPLTQPVLEQIKGLSGIEFILTEIDGRRSGTLPFDGVRLPAAHTLDVEDFPNRSGPAVLAAGRRYHCLRFVLPEGSPNQGDVLHLLYPDERLRGDVWEAVRPALLLGAASGVLALALTAWTAGGLVRRVAELERRTSQIAAGDFSPMPLPGQDDEIRDLGRSVNDMADRLARLQETVRNGERLRLLGQVSGGLAHQLRNAVTGARLAVQVHLRECPADDPEALRLALRQLTLVEATVRRFLELGRADAPARKPCDLSAVVGEAVALLRPQCDHAGIALEWSDPGPVTVVGSAGQLGHLFLNVIGNAVEAAGPGGRVAVTLLPGDSVAVEVSDTGSGPAADVAGRLFEAFVTGKSDGVGLGLAVAKQAAEAHGGRVGWRREAGRTIFRVELPAG